MLNWLFALLLNLFCVVCFFFADELRTIQFYLVNFQCWTEAFGSLFWLIELTMKLIIQYFFLVCGLEYDYDTNVEIGYKR